MADTPVRKRNHKVPRQPLPVRDPQERVESCQEVAIGFSQEAAVIEALRCLQCKPPKCVDACPIHTDIKAFIDRVAMEDFDGAYDVILKTNPFPGICGRVCQHELFCEKECVLTKKFEPVAIGSLERFVSDYHREHALAQDPHERAVNQPEGLKIALVGSGPAALICASDLAERGYKVTIFEALHELGGVLSYGIPSFRLPREIIRDEIARLRELGVEMCTNYIVGKTITVDELFDEGFAAVFVGSGAGLPNMMEIPGENLIGVYTANEFLTRINLMNATNPLADTPVRIGKRTMVIGGGNSAMDAARWAKRAGAEATVLFRRGRAEMRARLEEIEHAEEEGVKFEFLAAPVALHGDEKGILREIECIRMELGEVDESGRRSPVPIPGSNYRVPVDTVVAAIGQSPNPTVQQSTPQLLTKRGKIVVDASGKTSMSRVYAGGDVVRGGSTVILAMKDGRAAARAIDEALRAEQDAGRLTAPTTTGETANPIRIVENRRLSPDINSYWVYAPRIAKRWRPGQFVIVRPTPDSERIPLTLVDGDVSRGAVRLIAFGAGKTTRAMAVLAEGEVLSDLLGPLGRPAHIEKVGTVVCVGGGVGVAELLPVAKAFRDAGNYVVSICGARTDSLRILTGELAACSDEVLWATDDGSFGFQGNVVQLLRHWRETSGRDIGLVHAIGPIVMMRATADATRDWGVRTMASVNPIMVDGTGMCGGCRVTVGGKSLFACVDGPEFDAHTVDFDELARRNRAYVEHERAALERHECRIGLGE